MRVASNKQQPTLHQLCGPSNAKDKPLKELGENLVNCQELNLKNRVTCDIGSSSNSGTGLHIPCSTDTYCTTHTHIYIYTCTFIYTHISFTYINIYIYIIIYIYTYSIHSTSFSHIYLHISDQNRWIGISPHVFLKPNPIWSARRIFRGDQEPTCRWRWWSWGPGRRPPECRSEHQLVEHLIVVGSG